MNVKANLLISGCNIGCQCYLVTQSTLQHTVPGYFTNVTGAELPQLSCYSILLHQWLLRSGHPTPQEKKKNTTLNRTILIILTASEPGFCQVYLGVVELHGIIRGQGHTQTFVEELFEGIFRVLQEKAVVAQRRHGNWHLGQVVQVLQHRTLRDVGGDKLNRE